jgi:FtsP/CotA-like multicopper oxidase with cupredoxin domain
MRPLLSINGIMTINGRTDFHGGKSEDPTIGTVEDWYIINAMNLGHPIHFHLVNFQVT